MQYTGSVQKKYGAYLTGPAEPLVNRVRNQYLMELMLKLPRDSALIRQCKQDLLEAVALLHQAREFRGVTVVPDVDPV